MKQINIIGGGLAGSEAALYLGNNDWKVTLYEMRPGKITPAHQSGDFAELVCSNSFKSKLSTTASGLLKSEMKLLDCVLLPIAEKFCVPAGNALAIDRNKFAENITKIVEDHPNINVVREEVKNICPGKTIIATGPLTSEALTAAIIEKIGDEHLYFFDAVAPIVSAESLDNEIVFSKTRYDKGDADYINCPFSKEEYYQFVDALNDAQKHDIHEFESDFFNNIDFSFYENCTPIEELARRGEDTLRFGVMRPVGLEDPRTGRRPWAVIQLRAEQTDLSSYNLVGCQTMLKYGEQKRVFQLIPGLKNAEFLRYGSIHRNTYLNGPHILNPDLSLKCDPDVFIAGQLSGVEGYVESILSGLLIAKIINDEFDLEGGEVSLPDTTISGQLWRHLISESSNYQPMNANFGLLPDLPERIRDKKKKKQALSDRALDALKSCLN